MSAPGRPRLELLFDALLDTPALHAPGTPIYALLKAVARDEIERRFASVDAAPADLGRLGSLCLPYHRMGAVDSLDLFGLDELIILLFYWCNRERYRRAVDIGANLGLHALVLARCGLAVQAFEPDPQHYALLERNLALNAVAGVDLHNAAVSVEDGETTFVRVLGNTTGSHLLGSKDSYGERQYITVRTAAARPLFAWADLVKIDAEGHERAILCATDTADWKGTDAIVEIGSAANATAVYDHLRELGLGLFAQRVGWGRVERVSDMPTSHRDGSLFVSLADRMPWPSSR